MTLQNTVILCLISAALAAGFTHFYFPQVKTVEVEKDVVHNNIVTVTHTVKEANGVIDTTTTTTDHTTNVLTDTKKEFNVSPNWMVSASAETNIHLEAPTYGLHIQRRILGPVFIGGLVNTKGYAGVSVGMEF